MQQQVISSKTKVIVGMSGGVDSSVAALLLQKQGLAVEGLFMKNWEEDDTETYCSATTDVQDAQQVCDKLGIKLHTVNFAAEYWEAVFSHFLTEYKQGRTPNPDILCNREIKFRVFLDYAKLLNADLIATGHYANKITNKQQYLLGKGADQEKDQSYFLYALNQQQLASALFPLANYTKYQIREIAQKAGFTNHQKKDSTGICFIGERKFKEFLQHYIPAQPGNIITTTGKVIGKHDGLMYHTIGQRQGLKIGGQKASSNEPWYVIDKDLTNNLLIVAQGKNHPALFASKLLASQMTWITSEAPSDHFNCHAKIRYRQTDQLCRVEVNSNNCIVSFNTPQRAITPGQSVVFYNNNICLGGGVIEQVIKD